MFCLLCFSSSSLRLMSCLHFVLTWSLFHLFIYFFKLRFEQISHWNVFLFSSVIRTRILVLWIYFFFFSVFPKKPNWNWSSGKCQLQLIKESWSKMRNSCCSGPLKYKIFFFFCQAIVRWIFVLFKDVM